MQTNQLDAMSQSQEKIPFISTEKELRALKANTLYRMKCKLCGKELTKKSPDREKNFITQSKFLCKVCGPKQTMIKRYGIDSYGERYASLKAWHLLG